MKPPARWSDAPSGDGGGDVDEGEARAGRLLRAVPEPGEYGSLAASQTLARVRQRVAERPAARLRWRWAMALLAPALWLLWRGGWGATVVAPPRVVMLEGSAEVRADDVRVRSGRVLVQTTRAPAHVGVAGADGARVEVRAASAVEVRVYSGRVVVGVYAGSARVEWADSGTHELRAGRELSRAGEAPVAPARALEVERILGATGAAALVAAPAQPVVAQAGVGAAPIQPVATEAGPGAAPMQPVAAQAGVGAVPMQPIVAQVGVGAAPMPTATALSPATPGKVAFALLPPVATASPNVPGAPASVPAARGQAAHAERALSSVDPAARRPVRLAEERAPAPAAPVPIPAATTSSRSQESPVAVEPGDEPVPQPSHEPRTTATTAASASAPLIAAAPTPPTVATKAPPAAMPLTATTKAPPAAMPLTATTKAPPAAVVTMPLTATTKAPPAAVVTMPPAATTKVPLAAVVTMPPAPPAPAPPVVFASPPSALAAETAALAPAVRALRHDRNAAAALRALDDYDTRHPAGLMRDDAEVLRIEALVLAGRRRDALHRLDQRALASLPRARLLAVLRGELRAEEGRCEDAERDLAAALADHDELAERALMARAECRSRRGDSVGARASLDEYLDRFPTGRFAARARQRLGR